MRSLLIQRVIGYFDIRIWIVGDHNTVYGRYLWGELCRPLARLRKNMSVLSSVKIPEYNAQHTLRSSMLVFRILR